MCDLEAVSKGGHTDCPAWSDTTPGLRLDPAMLWQTLLHPGMSWPQPLLSTIFWLVAAVLLITLAFKATRLRKGIQ